MAPKLRSAGSAVLAIYLLGEGLVRVVHLGFAGIELVLGGLAIAAGVLILIGR